MCVCYHIEQHGQHFLVDEILGEVEQDFSIVCLQSRAVRHTEIKSAFTSIQNTDAETVHVVTAGHPEQLLKQLVDQQWIDQQLQVRPSKCSDLLLFFCFVVSFHVSKYFWGSNCWSDKPRTSTTSSFSRGLWWRAFTRFSITIDQSLMDPW